MEGDEFVFVSLLFFFIVPEIQIRIVINGKDKLCMVMSWYR